ncbi:S8 family serine peptidase [Actinomadura roseirufa]|uniref:S8 family serine peptidase n=1 Tax=Actinomadura roseirufa TaxID=2094049 RepID=UPI0013F14672|nr:S8 family serine peptidase [Actinomadura roseirufa]
MHAAPALALPSPRNEEWWFGAWEITNKVWPQARGEGVTVAVVDSGVEADLPDLRGVVLKGTDFDGPASGDGRRDHDTEKGGHGTAMAALIAGQGTGTGMVGVAPESRILPIAAEIDNYRQTIHYAVDHGAKVINFSSALGAAHCTEEIQEFISYAVEHDVVVVASAGNEGDNSESGNSPANCPGVLAVGAATADLKAWEKSTPGDNVMVTAPGVLVGSIGKAGVFESRHNGTSQAAALTSGVVALVRSKYPKMSGREVVQRILATAKDMGPKGWDKKTGYGAIIPYLALTANIPRNAPNPVYESFDRVMSKKEKAPSSRAGSSTRSAGETRDGGGIGVGAWSGILAASILALGGGALLFVRGVRGRNGRS